MRRISGIASVVALVLFALPFRGWSGESPAPQPARQVRLELRNGSSELVHLNGVGCDKALCSRVAINGGLPFDHLDAISDICNGRVRVALSDGTKQSVIVIPDNRVLYVTGENGRSKKIHLDDVTSLRFMRPESR